MSQHATKEKRHKEASLADVISVVAGPPNVLKESTEIDGMLCLTVNFKKGGGIDLVFQAQAQRDLWFEVLNRVILPMKS